MKITNKLNLPAPLVRAVSRHSRDRIPGRISVTEMIQPPQIRALTIRHEAEIEEDAGDRIWSLLGTLLHGVLERNAQGLKDTISEEELKIEIEGWTVVGHYDLSEMILDGELLTDWKLTSVWSVKEGSKTEWEQQLNCYAQLIRNAGRLVNQIQIVAIGRDWSKSKARFDPDYPQQQVKVMAVPLWTPEETLKFMKERVLLHQKAEQGSWPDCTPEERWARPDLYALMKKGQKKAVKLFESKDLAEKWLEQILGGKASHFIQHRPGESIRCAAYCPVASKCEQWAKLNPTLATQLEESIKVAQQQKGVAA